MSSAPQPPATALVVEAKHAASAPTPRLSRLAASDSAGFAAKRHHPLLGDLLAGMSSAPQPPAAALVVQAKLTRSAATPWDILSWAHRLSWTGIVNPDMTTAITCNPVRLWKYCNTPGMRSIFSARIPLGGLEDRVNPRRAASRPGVPRVQLLSSNLADMSSAAKVAYHVDAIDVECICVGI